MKLGVTGVAVLVGSLFVGASAAQAQGTPASLPDLLLDGNRVQTSLSFQIENFSKNDCAVQEGLLTGIGKRALMRFDVAAANIGNADLVLGNPALHPDYDRAAARALTESNYTNNAALVPVTIPAKTR